MAAVAAFVAALSSGCAASVLVRPDDRTYARSMERYQAVQKLVASAPEPEAAMFLQAEGFFRYRFTPPPRSPGTYLAQAAAAAADFPALQAVASSFDLFELRLKIYDAAVQVFESLLERYPQSQLRPLTLYRLGWAYRSRITRGFPRKGPDEPLDALALEYPDSPLAALAREARQVPWKSNDTATALSIIPGAAHLYVGERGSGVVRLGIALLSAAMIAVPGVLALRRGAELTWPGDWPLAVSGLLGLVALSIDYTLAYQDGLRAVMQFNEQQEEAFEGRHPQAP